MSTLTTGYTPAGKRKERADLLAEAHAVVSAAKTAGRDLTAPEQTRLQTAVDRIHTIDADLDAHGKAAGKSADILRRISALPPGYADADGPAGARSYLAPRGKIAAAVAESMRERQGPTIGAKALLSAGDVFTDLPLLFEDPASRPRPPSSLLEALPVNVVPGPVYRYLRQSTRTNNAAPVAVGAVKPTSVYGLAPVDGRLQVIAHISEPFDEYWVADSSSLLAFLEAELTFGLQVAIETQLLAGNGTAPNLRGLANTSGVQVQAFTVDMFRTTRKAVTAVETLGHTPRIFVLNPADWEAIETAAFTGGAYVLNAEGRGNLPVDAAARRLWGVPVALCTTQAAGGGWLLSEGAVEIVTDGRVKVQTGTTGDDFTRNQLRMRAECRADLAVTAPAGVVNIDLAA